MDGLEADRVHLVERSKNLLDGLAMVDGVAARLTDALKSTLGKNSFGGKLKELILQGGGA